MSRLVLEYYRDLKSCLPDIDLDLLAVGSEEGASREIAESNGFQYFEHPNSPLSGKWEFGLKKTRLCDPDGVVFVGSDDLLSTNIIRHFAECLRRHDLFVGYMDSYFLDLQSGKLLKWKGYVGPRWRSRRVADTIGAGRMLARPLLEAIDFSLWAEINAERHLDNQVRKSLSRLNMHPIAYEDKVPVKCGEHTFQYGQLGLLMDSVDGCIVDIKTSTCITPLHRYAEVPGTFETVSSPWDFLARHFPAKTIAGLNAMREARESVGL